MKEISLWKSTYIAQRVQLTLPCLSQRYCIKCDVIVSKLKHTTDEEEKTKLQQDHELQLRKSEKAREAMKASLTTN